MSPTAQQISITYTEWINGALREMADEDEEQRQLERSHRNKTRWVGCISGVLLVATLFLV